MDPQPALPTVVLADDEPHIRMMMKIVLERAGFKLLAEATNGQEAVDCCHRLEPDLVLLDINMPIMNGDKALQEILADRPHTAVIMLTSVADSETVTQCIELGAADYLRKDTPVQEIGGRILKAWQSWTPSSVGPL